MIPHPARPGAGSRSSRSPSTLSHAPPVGIAVIAFHSIFVHIGENLGVGRPETIQIWQKMRFV